MKEYDVYLPFEPANGASSWSWLERLLQRQFGDYRRMTGHHVGGWGAPGVAMEGRVRTYSICAEEGTARPFFKELKQQLKAKGLGEIVVLEKDAPGPKG